MLRTHEHFKELCAAAAFGQVSAVELSELKQHALTCDECQSLLEDFGQIAAQGLPELDVDNAPDEMPRMTARFVARARAEGIELSRTPALRESTLTPTRKIFGIRKAAPIIGIAAIAALMLFKTVSVNNPEQYLHIRSSPVPAPASQTVIPTASTQSPDPNRIIAELKQQLRSLEVERGLLMARNKADRKAWEVGDQARHDLSLRVSALEKANLALDENVRTRDSQLGQLQEQITRLKSETEADRLASLAEEGELNSLRSSVAKQAEDLKDKRQLSEAAKRAQDLLVARNLHIVDVHDTGEDGKSQRPFGRIFYVEGKSLVFYAYDLTDSGELNAKVQFYVWGEKLGATRTAKGLGIFRSDDVKAGRWILIFNDQKVLSQIDSVFVTVESGKNVATKPSGDKVLYAYLGHKPNHP